MARKFWEKLSNTRLQFYDEPQDLREADLDQLIADNQEILALPDSAKAILVEANPTVGTEAEFDAIFENELARLADIKDYMSGQTVTLSDTIDVVDHRWMSPADMALGPGTIVSFCGEEVANPAVNAIDGANGTNWQHDVNEVHQLEIDLGYRKRIDGIRVVNSATPGGPLQLSGVDVRVANRLGRLDDTESLVGTGLAFTDPNQNDRDLTLRNGRFIRITVGSTGHGNNNITIREIEFRTRPRTFGL